MTVKTSVPLSPQHEEFARKLVEDGHFPSLAAVVEHGLELVRDETRMRQEDVEALRALLLRRMQGPFLSEEESRVQIEEMIARKKAQYGL